MKVVSKTIPNYLRIHRESRTTDTKPTSLPTSTIDSLWDAFSAVTGWRVEPQTRRRGGPIEVLPTVGDGLIAAEDCSSIPAVSQSAATEFAQAIQLASEQWEQTRETIRTQNAELAVRASIVGEQRRPALAAELEQVLADAILACGCDAGAIYLLDSETKVLQTRVVVGLGEDACERSSRPLRGSRGDLEALVQGVVTIDDFQAYSIDTWNTPEADFAAGICAALLQDEVPIGTIWLFARQRCEFGGRDQAAARLAARQLALQLGQEVTVEQTKGEAAPSGPVRDIAHWQYEALPVGSELATGWRADGMIESPQAWATGWHAWDVLPDGTLMMAIAQAVDASPAGAMKAAVARAALTAHTNYRHTPAQLMQRINDTLWQSSTAQQLVSLLYLRVDPETGEGEVAAAGGITAIIASRYGYRPLIDGLGKPLAWDIDANSHVESFRMMPDESLLAYGVAGLADGVTQRMLGECLRESMRQSDSSPLAAIRRSLAGHNLAQERGMASLTRYQATCFE